MWITYIFPMKVKSPIQDNCSKKSLEKIKLFLLADDMMLYIDNSNDMTENIRINKWI
jgi:hypothetical protein